MRKLRSIQVLRAVAVTGAITSHATFFPHGAAGVDLFFVISGVIIGVVMQGRSAGEFMRARLWRIYPIYWFNLFPLLVVAAVDGIIRPARLASSLTLWPVWGTFAHPYLVPAWTLCFEMLFYSLVAIGLWCRRPWLVIPALLSAILLNVLTALPLFQFVGNPLVLEFCAGLAVLSLPKSRAAGAGALIIAVLVFMLAPPLHIASKHLMDLRANSVRVAEWGDAAAFFVYGALCFEDLFGRWADIPVFVGDASYSIYLSHYLVNLTFLIWWPFRVVLMLAAGSVMYLAVERPIMNWSRKIRSVPASPAAPVPIGSR